MGTKRSIAHRLLHDDATGYAVPGIAGGVREVVVDAGVNDMFGFVRIEVSAGRLEVWWVTFANRMHMEGMLPWRYVGEIEAYQDPTCGIGKLGLAQFFSATVF